ncbi:DNase I-like protein [Auricularia subglabra TFB-10046 SS5]|nr:DNase I-like protein [Auricularia subglabra TFB-10046 SS5]
MTSSTLSVRCLTFNCWGLKYVAKVRLERLRAIAHALADLTATAAANGTPFSFIALEEIWVHSDFEYVQRLLKENGTFKYSKYFFSGALGAGLAIFSAYPIRESHTHPFALNGSPLDVGGGDWYVGKGTGSIVVQPDFLNGQRIEVFVTHFYAKGGDDGPETHRAHRLVHAWQMSNIVRTAAERGHWVIAMGDYNSLPRSMVMRLLREHACLMDSWEAARTYNTEKLPTSPLASFVPGEGTHVTSSALARVTNEVDRPPVTAQEALHTRGVTADSPLNTWSAGKTLSEVAKRDFGKRLDYVLYRAPRGQLRCVQAEVIFTEPVPGQIYSYSDHFGLDVTLVAQPCIDIEQQERAVYDGEATMSEDTFENVLDAIRVAGPRADQNGRRLLLYLGVSLVVLLALLSAPFWSPRIDSQWGQRALAFAGILLTAVVTWFGTTALYVGFIYHNWEGRALRRVIEEMELWRERPGLSPS